MTANNCSFCYLACVPPKVPNGMPVSSYMRSLGCNGFNRFFWRVPTTRLRAVLSKPELANAIVFRRSRKVIGHSISECTGTVRLGSFVIIAYRLNKPSRRIRKVIQRALQRAPYFKLCPSVYAFPQLKRTSMTTSQSTIGRSSKRQSITTPRELVDILNGFDARVLRLSRLVVLDQAMERELVERMVSTRKAQCRRLTESCKSIVLSAHLQRSEYLVTRALRLKLSEIKYRYRAARAVLSFLKRQMNIDMSDELFRASRAISSCRDALRSAEEMQTSTPAETTH
ncbi:MAG: hypothetical protein WED04_05280 [Promethearchaeati archaeon SRVP18_Atabeyarchaeia-1]